MTDTINLVTAVPHEELKKISKWYVRDDLTKRFKKALRDELELNPPLEITHLQVADTLPQLETKMKELYLTGNLKDKCALVRIKVTVEIELETER